MPEKPIVDVRKYRRFRNGQWEDVRKHERHQTIIDVGYDARQKISKGKAMKLFGSKDSRAKTVDQQKETEIVYAVPNERWADTMNRSDVLGIDGKKPPKVDKLSSFAYPNQIVKYKGKIYIGDNSNRFKLAKNQKSKT